MKQTQTVKQITAAEPPWIAFTEPFLSPKLLEIRPIGNFHKHVVGLAK